MAHRLPEAQPADPPLRVLSRGTAQVQDYLALEETGTNRFHGWRFDASLGPEFEDTITKQKLRHGGRRKLVDHVIEIPADSKHRQEYILHLRLGDLWPADVETARAAGVPFEPHFMGEHPATSEKHGLDRAKLVTHLKALGVDVQEEPAPAPATEPAPAPTEHVAHTEPAPTEHAEPTPQADAPAHAEPATHVAEPAHADGAK